MYDVSDYADYYRAGSLKIANKAEQAVTPYPPYKIELPDLATYELRGERMLSSACYKGKCFQCAFAAMSAVEIEYNWGGGQKVPFESFCYGPFTSKFYKMGKPRAVPYKDSGSDYDTGWMDELCTERCGYDEWED